MGVVWLGWNIVWIVQGMPAPSMLTATVGLPSPTTGGTRAVEALARGNIAESLWLHPLAVPIGLFWIGCFAALGWQAIRRRRPTLPSWVLKTWIAVFGVAWVIKLASDPATW